MSLIAQSTKDASDFLEKLEHEVFEKRPVLGETYNRDGELSLLEFTRQQFSVPENNQIPDQRKKDVISVIADHARSVLGESAAVDVKNQLLENYSVVTSDHHGPLTHPDFVNSNLLTAFAFQDLQNKKINNHIVLSCANVSFDNFSFPRGHLFHSAHNGETILNKFPFFGYKIHSFSVYRYPGFTQDDLDVMKRRLETWVGQEVIDRKKRDILRLFVDEIYNIPQALERETFSEQVTITNYFLWQKLFSESSLRTNLYYLELESITNTLLFRFHLKNDTPIRRILCDDNYQSLLLSLFDGITQAFSTERKTGTFLFWAIPKGRKYRVALWKRGNVLESDDKSYVLKISPEAILEAINANELIPSTMLSFILLGFYYGLCLIGGGGQTSYLARMKEAYIQLLSNVQDYESLRLCQEVSTNKLSFPYPSIAFLKGAKNEHVPSTLLDILLYGNKDSLEIIRKMAETITIRQGIARELPGLASMLNNGSGYVAESKSFTSVEIDKMTGFSEQLCDFASLV